MTSQILPRTALWLSLGTWVGSWAFFAFVVSRVAFQVLPGDVAGDLAGALLEVLHFSGAGLALVAAAAAAALGRTGWLVWLPVALALGALASELFLSPAIAAIRPSAIGALATEETSRRFGQLHTLSIGLFLVMHFISIGLLYAHARRDGLDGEVIRSAP